MFAVPLCDQDCEICFVLSRVRTTTGSFAFANNDDQMRYCENTLNIVATTITEAY